MKHLSVSVIIPNWNGEKLLRKHLKIVNQMVGEIPIIIVDDNSSDESVKYIQNGYPHIRLLIKNKHEGFASTVNYGVAHADTDIVILLNTDVVPEKGFLEPLLSVFSDDNVFAVACMDKSYDGDEVLLRGRGVAKWIKGYYIHQRGEIDKSNTAWVSGGSGAFRRSIWNVLGGMDTLYNPFYWEDIDLSYRAVKSGYSILFNSQSIVHHYHETGMIKQSFSPWWVKCISYRNQFIFIWKNTTDLSLLLEHIVWTPVRLVQSFVRMDSAFFIGYILAIIKIPIIFIHRMNQQRLYTKNDRNIVS